MDDPHFVMVKKWVYIDWKAVGYQID